MFRREGFHGATVERIAEAAEVSVGTIYFHFGSKEALYLSWWSARSRCTP